MRETKHEVFIPLTRGLVAVVDGDDYPKVQGFSWFAHAHRNEWEAARTAYPGKKTIRMHRAIMGPLPEQEIDHINGNPLDNRRQNLRICAPAQNGCNTRIRRDNKTGFKGVRHHATSRGYQAYVQRSSPKQFFHLGIFKTAEEAARAYDTAALKHFGEFARLNFPISER